LPPKVKDKKSSSKGLKYTAFSYSEYQAKKTMKRNSKTRLIEDLTIEEVDRYFKEEILPRSRKKEIWVQMKLNDHWERICGSLLYHHLRVVGMSGSRLIIESDAGIWVEQARMFEATLRDRIMDFIPGIKIESLFFRVGNFKVIANPSQHANEQESIEQQMQKMLQEAKKRKQKK